MKKIFLDQFYLQTISADPLGNVKFSCFATSQDQEIEETFFFDFSMHIAEFSNFIRKINDFASRISGLITGTFTSFHFAQSLNIDFCWLKIRLEAFLSIEEFETQEKIYLVEDYGFIPE